jgi:hypothetical protein
MIAPQPLPLAVPLLMMKVARRMNWVVVLVFLLTMMVGVL